MPASNFRSEVVDLALATAWSLWAELGVSGWTRRHSDVAIDLEPLIIATAYLGRLDARLLEESLDWSVASSHFVSTDRLRNLVKASDTVVRDAFGRYAATVRGLKRVSWPGEGAPHRVSPTNRSLPPDLLRPALVQLRLRAVFGVSARAEVLRWLANDSDRFVGSLEVAMKAAYGKDNIADTLNLLSLGGVVIETTLSSAGGQRVFRLNRSSELAALLLNWSGARQQRWDACFRVIVALVQFAITAPTEPAARAADIQRLLRSLRPDLGWLGAAPALRQGVQEVNEDFDAWAIVALRMWAHEPEQSSRS